MTFFDFATISPRCNAGCRSSKPRGGRITPRRGVYTARRLLLRSPLPAPRAVGAPRRRVPLAATQQPAKTAATDGEKREKILRDHAMKESAIMGWSNQPDGAAALPVLVMLDARCPFLRVTHCVDRGVGLATVFLRVEVCPDGCLRKTLEFYRGGFAQSVEAAGYAF